MPKSVFSNDYGVFLDELREARHRARLTQVELAEAMGVTQTYISKCERGERRLDIIELNEFCQGMGIRLSTFVRRLEAEIG
jgi:transcriptional regulator with XRE-family HTH domain